MSGTPFKVRGPSGRTVTVKVPPTKSCREIVLAACRGLGLSTDGAASASLIHKGKALDLDNPVRFSGLSQNASLELRIAERPASSGRQGGGSSSSSSGSGTGGGSSGGSGGKARVCVRMAGGLRFEALFPPAATSLSGVLRNFAECSAAAPPGSVPTVTVARKRYTGQDELESTTLASLGITGGSSVAMNLTFSQPPAAAPAAARPPAAAAPALAAAAAKEEEEEESKSAAQHETSSGGSDAATMEAAAGKQSEQDASSSSSSSSSPRKSLAPAEAALGGMLEALFSADARVAVKTLTTLVSNVLSRPGDPSRRTVKLENKNFDSRVGRHPTAVAFLESLGFRRHQAVLRLDPANESPAVFEGAYLALVRAAAQLEDASGGGSSSSSSSSSAEAAAAQAQLEGIRRRGQAFAAAAAAEEARIASFDPFAASIVRAEPQPRSSKDVAMAVDPAEASGGGEKGGEGGAGSSSSSSSSSSAAAAAAARGLPMSDTERKLAKLKERQAELEKAAERVALDQDRQLRVLMPGETGAAAAAAAATASGGAGSAGRGAPPSDTSMLASAMKRRKQEIEESGILKTRAMRELDALRQAKVYATTVIRITLPDRSSLQASFRPGEPIRSAFEVVSGALRPELRREGGGGGGGDAFYLYVSPPRKLLDPKASFASEGLQPAAVVMLGWKDGCGPAAAAAAAAAATSSSSSSSPSPGSCFLPELLEAAAKGASGGAAAPLAVPTAMPLVPAARPSGAGASSSSSSSSSSLSAGTEESKNGGGAARKMPKWFKR